MVDYMEMIPLLYFTIGIIIIFVIVNNEYYDESKNPLALILMILFWPLTLMIFLCIVGLYQIGKTINKEKQNGTK